MKHRKIGGMPGDTDKVGDSLLERGVFAIVLRKVRKWKESQMDLGDKQSSQSMTVKGLNVGMIGLVLLQLFQAMKGWLLSIGLSEALINFIDALLITITGGGARHAAIGLRKSQGETKAAASSARLAAIGASNAAQGAEVAAQATKAAVKGGSK